MLFEDSDFGTLTISELEEMERKMNGEIHDANTKLDGIKCDVSDARQKEAEMKNETAELQSRLVYVRKRRELIEKLHGMRSQIATLNDQINEQEGFLSESLANQENYQSSIEGLNDEIAGYMSGRTK